MNNRNTIQHVAIIPDGNRRWAKEKGKKAIYGHQAGYERIREILAYSKTVGISYITIWAFSTENWKREESEIFDLMNLIAKGLEKLHIDAKKEKSRVVHIGRRDRLNKSLLSLIEKTEEETREYKDFTLCIAIDYGGEDEILRAGKKMLTYSHKNKILFDFLDTSILGVPSPDLIIRTGGDYRTSGFLPLQSTYSEWVFEEKLFPDFNTTLFQKALDNYLLRLRRFGK